MTTISCNLQSITDLFSLPLFELVNTAYDIHQKNFQQLEMELCTLLSIKTGSCPEDCAYCPQSAHYQTNIQKEKLLNFSSVITKAENAKANGAKRFCLGAAWRNPPEKELKKVLEMIKAVKEIGLETCATLGMLSQEQADQLKEHGLDFYNHNLDTSPTFYKTIITTRTYQERLDTLKAVSSAGIHICCGAILGMGETLEDRAQLLLELKKLSIPPKTIPINKLIPIQGTPLANTKEIDDIEFIKTIAVTRILFPQAVIRLAAGRENMSEATQAWCFMSGANSIFIGDKLLTAKNPEFNQDLNLLKKLGYKIV